MNSFRIILDEQGLVILELLLRVLEGGLIVDALEGAGARSCLCALLLCDLLNFLQRKTKVICYFFKLYPISY